MDLTYLLFMFDTLDPNTNKITNMLLRSESKTVCISCFCIHRMKCFCIHRMNVVNVVYLILIHFVQHNLTQMVQIYLSQHIHNYGRIHTHKYKDKATWASVNKAKGEIIHPLQHSNSPLFLCSMKQRRI